MFLQEHRRWKLMVAILTLSLLTVMAGAAVAPALGVIQEYFSGESKMMVQLIISMPAVFIAVTNLFFEKMCRICKAKTLTLIGLGMYIVFGCGAGLFSNIYLVLVCRALADEFSGVPAGRGQRNRRAVFHLHGIGKSRKKCGNHRNSGPFRGALHRSVHHTGDCDRL